MSAAPSLRIDKLLWYLRLARTRSVAQRIVAEGHVRRNGARVARSHEPIAVGDILTVPVGAGVRVVEVLALPARRGPASEAQGCYRVLDDPASLVLAAAPRSAATGKPQP